MEAQMLEEIERRKQERIEEAKRREVRCFLTCLPFLRYDFYKPTHGKFNLALTAIFTVLFRAIVYLISQNLHLAILVLGKFLLRRALHTY